MTFLAMLIMLPMIILLGFALYYVPKPFFLAVGIYIFIFLITALFYEGVYFIFHGDFVILKMFFNLGD